MDLLGTNFDSGFVDLPFVVVAIVNVAVHKLHVDVNE
jgi:hypothetical protein